MFKKKTEEERLAVNIQRQQRGAERQAARAVTR